MKLLIWSTFGVLALLWTGGALAVHGVLQWAAGRVASGEAIELGQAVAAWPVPAWANYWLDPGAVQAARDGMLWALDSLRQAGPWVNSALGWLLPVTWLLWGLGLAVLLGLTALAHFAAQRLAQPETAVALPQAS